MGSNDSKPKKTKFPEIQVLCKNTKQDTKTCVCTTCLEKNIAYFNLMMPLYNDKGLICPLGKCPKVTCDCQLCAWVRIKTANASSTTGTTKTETVTKVQEVKPEPPEVCRSATSAEQEKEDNLLASRKISAPQWMHKFIMDHGELKQAMKGVSKIMIFSDGKYINIDGDSQAVTRMESMVHKLLLQIPTQYTIFELDVDAKFYKFIIGKDGKSLNKIRADTNTDIDVPGRSSSVRKITIIGKIPDVERARNMIEKIINESERKIGEIRDEYRVKKIFHKALIGNKGMSVRSMSNVSGASIHFPKEEENSDLVIIQGTRQEIDKAKQLLENAILEIKKQRGIGDSDSDSSDTKKGPSAEASVYNEIMVQLICQRCIKTMSPPIYMCGNDHNVCHECKAINPTCACGKLVQSRRNFPLENLAGKLKTSCEYFKLGCPFVGTKTELQAHETTCAFTPKFVCKYSSEKCPFMSPSNAALLEHERHCTFVPKVHCQYFQYGCPVENVQALVSLHEKICTFIAISCPMKDSDENCPWVGSYDHLKNHTMANHGNFLQAVVKREILQRDLKRYKKVDPILVFAHGELFKVVCTTLGPKTHAVFSAECLNPRLTEPKMYIFQLGFVDQIGSKMLFCISQFCKVFSSEDKTNQLSIPRKLLEPYCMEEVVYFRIDFKK